MSLIRQCSRIIDVIFDDGESWGRTDDNEIRWVSTSGVDTYLVTHRNPSGAQLWKKSFFWATLDLSNLGGSVPVKKLNRDCSSLHLCPRSRSPFSVGKAPGDLWRMNSRKISVVTDRIISGGVEELGLVGDDCLPLERRSWDSITSSLLVTHVQWPLLFRIKIDRVNIKIICPRDNLYHPAILGFLVRRCVSYSD